jgi:tetratricopeptide (TPR) repeat protein
VATLGVALLSVLTYRQAGIWKDSITLWTREIELDPDCAIGWQNRGFARHERGDREGALEDYTASLALDAIWIRPRHNRAVLLALRGDHEAAIAEFTEVLRRNPMYADAYYNRAISRSTRGDLPGAIADTTRVLELAPSSAPQRCCSARHSRDGRGISRPRSPTARKPFGSNPTS